MTSVSPPASVLATSSTAARPSRRSRHSLISSGKRRIMRRSQFSFSSLRDLVVQEEMDGSDFVRVQAAGVLDGAGGGQVQPVHEHQDDVTAQDGHLGRFVARPVRVGAPRCGTGGSAG